MHLRTLIIERDDPEEPGLLIRRYARIGVCWEPTLGDWGWFRHNARGQVLSPMVGPFPAAEAAFEDALARLGGRWEEAEDAVS
ncbi:hypothetical protein [Paracraurococcus lichenis]|uniref:WGR domain-containing protein n=1 Tax=Paracraurococcus lichenis TaxID=3064888 RepID=A0ABT9E8W9_9PROT|nr:hypothetical protein [Paracraurococcus sp. LOR1-02]MDO9712642.1 hypothetical protein [Paracraurococcus sp. LOR1-02]